MSRTLSHFAPRLIKFLLFKFNGENGSFSTWCKNQAFFIFVLGHVDFYVSMKNKPKPTSVDGKAFRDAIIDCYLKKATVRNVPHLYDVPKRQVMNALDQLSNINSICKQFGQSPLLKTSDHMQIFCWASKYAKANISDGSTDYKKCHSLLLDAQGMKLYDIYEEYGVTPSAHKCR